MIRPITSVGFLFLNLVSVIFNPVIRKGGTEFQPLFVGSKEKEIPLFAEKSEFAENEIYK